MKYLIGFILSMVFVVVCLIKQAPKSTAPEEKSPVVSSTSNRASTPVTTAPPLPQSVISSSPVTAGYLPALDAQAKAMALYPALGVASSPLNQKFLTLYREVQARNPKLFTQPDWPLQLVKQAVAEQETVSIAAVQQSPPVQETPTAPQTQSPQPAAQIHINKKVVIYSTAHCPYCKMAKEYLKTKGINFQEIDIEKSSAGNAAFKRLGGNGVPLITVGQQKINGYDQGALDRLLH